MKTVKERDNNDLLELTLQLHSRALNFPSKEMDKAFNEDRQELVCRLNPKEPETVHGNEAGKGSIQKKFCEVCSQETYHDSHGCLGTSFG